MIQSPRGTSFYKPQSHVSLKKQTDFGTRLIVTSSHANITPVHLCMLNYMKLVKLAYPKKTLGCYFSVLHLAPCNSVFRPFHSPVLYCLDVPDMSVWHLRTFSPTSPSSLPVQFVQIFNNHQNPTSCLVVREQVFQETEQSLSGLVNIMYLSPVVRAGIITVRNFPQFLFWGLEVYPSVTSLCLKKILVPKPVSLKIYCLSRWQ